MKKFLLMFSTVLMLTVCLCVPSFAFVDFDSVCPDSYNGKHLAYEHPVHFYYDGRYYGICVRCDNAVLFGEGATPESVRWDILDSILIDGFVYIDGVRYDRACDCALDFGNLWYISVDGVHFVACPECKTPLPDAVQEFWFYACADEWTCTGTSCLACSWFSCDALLNRFEDIQPYVDSLILYEDESNHYLACADCGACVVVCSANQYDDPEEFPSLVDCFECVKYFYLKGIDFPGGVSPSDAVRCPNFSDLSSGVDFSVVGIAYDDTDHYYYCLDCGAYVAFSIDYGYEFPHTGDSCEECAYYADDGTVIYGELPRNSAVSTSITDTVNVGVASAASWVSTFATTIVTTPILLISAVLAFIGFGIGIFKRLRT